MNSRFKYILMPLLVGAVTFSCDKKDMDEVTPDGVMKADNSNAATSSNFIFNEDFEGSTAFDGRHTQFGSSYSFQMVTSPVFSGSKSGKFELRSSDSEVANGTRAEVIVADPATNKNRWYSYAAYFPSKDYAYDSESEVISQWWQSSGTTQATSLRVRKDRLILRTGNNSGSLKEIDLGAVPKDSWQEFVFHFVHSYGSDGLIEIWRNGTKILEHKGGNMYDTKMPNWKIGIYKAAWNSGSSETTKRVIYFDNVRVGNENASLAEMTTTTTDAPVTSDEPSTTEPAPTEDPVSTETPSTSTSSQISGITLIDASTEKDLLKLSSGSTLSFSALGTKTLNFRADLASGVGSVKFKLEGAKNHTYTDNAAPHALFGDDGNGNYYFNNEILPTGNYTLTATPYSGDNASGTAGTPVTYSFSIVESGSNIISEEPAPTNETVSSETPTTVISSQITSITLINASKDRDMMKLSDGATLSFSELGAKAFNFRADLASGVGSVKFKLEGAKNHTYTDNAAPHALFGDNGKGNYYFNNEILPTGSYKLTATPYSGDNASGTAGTPVTISFTIKN